MGRLAINKYFSFLTLVLTTLVAVFTFLGLYGGDAIPTKNTAMAMIVYVMPLLLIANVVLLLFWLLRRRLHWALIPAITLLCCIPYTGTVFQIRIFKPKATPGDFVVATYNVARFGREASGFKAEDILNEMKKRDVAVLCLQEYSDISGDKLISTSYKTFFPYMAKGRDDMVIYSRLPIVGSETIDFEGTNNSAQWADIELGGEKIRVFNVHLETTGINGTLHQAMKLKNTGLSVKNSRLLYAIYGNYTVGMVARSGQVNQVAAIMRESPYPIVLCGDFNDVPYSYTYNTMKGKLKDGFKEAGTGFMYTYRSTRKRVRIDYIFHDKLYKATDYYAMRVNYSDHYPVFITMHKAE